MTTWDPAAKAPFGARQLGAGRRCPSFVGRGLLASRGTSACNRQLSLFHLGRRSGFSEAFVDRSLKRSVHS